MRRIVAALALSLALPVLLAGCDNGTSDVDAGICKDQATDLAQARTIVDKWAGPAFDFAPGEEQTTFETIGSAVSALTGYVPENERLATAVDRARDGLQGFYDDWTEDGLLDGSGQSVDTAQAALKALDDTCADLS